ncbi:MAG: DUF222 domain-containing protein, partial [Nocardioidaceae bacterium]
MEMIGDNLSAIEAEVADVCGVLNVAHARLVRLTARLLASGDWKGIGIRSPEQWLAWHTGLSPERARQIVTVARRRTELPSVTTSLDEGELSIDQAVAVSKYTPADNEASVATFAKFTTVRQLRSTLSRYSFGPDANGAVAESTLPDHSTDPLAAERSGQLSGADREAVAPTRVSMCSDGSRFILRVDAPVDVGALLEKAIREAKDALIQAGHQAVTLGDGVVEVCHRSLCTISDVGRQSRYRVYVHLDTEGAWLNGGGVLPKALADKVMCDGVLQPVWLRGGKPVNVGRSQRIVPDRTRRFVVDRDRGCRFPSCGSKYWLEVHHIKHWREGGLTDTYNLVCLCPFHHDGHHRGDFLISGDADDPGGLSFTDLTGALIAAIRP